MAVESEARRALDEIPPDPGALRASVDRNPADLGARLRLGWGLFGGDDFAGAARAFEEALRAFPEEPDLLYGLALALKKSGDVERAAALFLEVDRLAQAIGDPGRSAILHRLAMGHHNHARSGHWGLKREIWGGD